MRSIVRGFAVAAALLAFATTDGAAQLRDDLALTATAPDTLVVPGVLAVLEPGVDIRARFAECGDEQRGVTELTGKFVEFEPDAFQMEVTEGDRTQLRQIPADDLLRLDLGIERSMTRRGTVIGAVSGVALGLAVAAFGDSGGGFDAGGAAYAGGAALFGLTGAGVGAVVGSRSTTIEWREIPLQGAAYCQ